MNTRTETPTQQTQAQATTGRQKDTHTRVSAVHAFIQLTEFHHHLENELPPSPFRKQQLLLVQLLRCSVPRCPTDYSSGFSFSSRAAAANMPIFYSAFPVMQHNNLTLLLLSALCCAAVSFAHLPTLNCCGLLSPTSYTKYENIDSRSPNS